MLAVLAERQPRALILASLTGWLAVLAMHSMLLVPNSARRTIFRPNASVRSVHSTRPQC
jgi:hypothetical protein